MTKELKKNINVGSSGRFADIFNLLQIQQLQFGETTLTSDQTDDLRADQNQAKTRVVSNNAQL